jgi:hypothetical protein
MLISADLTFPGGHWGTGGVEVCSARPHLIGSGSKHVAVDTDWLCAGPLRKGCDGSDGLGGSQMARQAPNSAMGSAREAARTCRTTTR